MKKNYLKVALMGAVVAVSSAMFTFTACEEEDKTPTSELSNTTWIDDTDPFLHYKLEFQEEGLACSFSAYSPLGGNITSINCTVKVSGSNIELYAFGDPQHIFYSGTFTKTAMDITHYDGTPQLHFIKQIVP